MPEPLATAHIEIAADNLTDEQAAALKTAIKAALAQIEGATYKMHETSKIKFVAGQPVAPD